MSDQLRLQCLGDEAPPEQAPPRHWAWRLFDYRLPFAICVWLWATIGGGAAPRLASVALALTAAYIITNAVRRIRPVGPKEDRVWRAAGSALSLMIAAVAVWVLRPMLAG
ncbi:MAG: hypothetical protein R3C00_07310 [Hyphomonas sp.]